MNPNSKAKAMSNNSERKDVYTRVTERIISDLEQGIRTWMKPWSFKHTAGRITKPLRHNGAPYRGNEYSLDVGRSVGQGIRRAHLLDHGIGETGQERRLHPDPQAMLRGTAGNAGADALRHALRTDNLGPDDRISRRWERGEMTAEDARGSNRRMHSHSLPADVMR